MSFNDPRPGGKGGRDDDPDRSGPFNRPNRNPRPDQGPPDLDEVFQDIKQRLGELFNRGGDGGNGGRNNGGGNFSPPGMSQNAVNGVVVVLSMLALTLWFASGFYIVDAAQRGLVLRFGKSVGVPTEPGLRWHLPYPIESHELVNLSEVRTKEIGYRGNAQSGKVPKEALMLTDDENIIDIQFAVQYVLKSPENNPLEGPFAYQFNNREPDDAVMQAAETSVREVIGKSKIDFVINEGRAQIATRVHTLMQSILDRYETGIQISKVTMQNAQPPEQVQAAFADAVKAGQDKDRQREEGQAYANDVIPKARGAAARLLEEANGYRQRMIATADGDASRFRQILSEYAKAPEVTRKRLYLETMQQIYANTSKVMVDAKGQGNLLYLPLDKLIQAGALSQRPGDNDNVLPTATQPEASSGETRKSGVPALNREVGRNRDREAAR